MITRPIRRFKAGIPQSPDAFAQRAAIAARPLNQMRTEVERFSRLRGGSGVAVTDTPGGPQLRLNLGSRIFIQLTGDAGPDGSYPWQQVIRVLEQGFTASTIVGSNDPNQPNYSPAFESQTGDTTLTADGTTYEAFFDRTSGFWLFDGKN